jgi:hypothetical protein
MAAYGLMAQEIQLKGQFLQDSMGLGEPVEFTLSAKYPAEMQILFPDSTHDFSPFEYQSKKYFTTKTDSLFSFDSAVFTLLSFEIEQFQQLRLPVFIILEEDSNSVYTQADSIFLQEMIPVVSDTLQLKTNTIFLKVDKDFNYPLLIVILVILLIIIVLVIVFFGKKLRLKWQIWRLGRKHEKFLELFRPQVTNPKTEEVEKLLFTWKKHVEIISKRPYAKLTSKEIHIMHQDDILYQNLQKMDKNIYSSVKDVNLSETFLFLIDYADFIFKERIKELQSHAK